MQSEKNEQTLKEYGTIVKGIEQSLEYCGHDIDDLKQKMQNTQSNESCPNLSDIHVQMEVLSHQIKRSREESQAQEAHF